MNYFMKLLIATCYTVRIIVNTRKNVIATYIKLQLMLHKCVSIAINTFIYGPIPNRLATHMSINSNVLCGI